MLRPSYSDLLEILEQQAQGQEQSDIIGSRYTVVIAAAKRARQLVDHAEPLISNSKVNKPVSIAVNELYAGKIKVHPRITDENIAPMEGIEMSLERLDTTLED